MAYADGGPISAKEMAGIEAGGEIDKDADGVGIPSEPEADIAAKPGEGPDGPTVESDIWDSDEGVTPESETNLTDDVDPNTVLSSSYFGLNGSGSTHSMTGVGASTDTGSNRFIGGGGGDRDPGYDKGPVVGDGSQAFPHEIHGQFGRSKPPSGGMSASA